MNIVSFMGILSAFTSLIPVCIIIAFKLFNNKSLLALLLYFLSTAVFNLMEVDIIPVPKLFEQRFGILVNYLDAPLMFIALLFFCTTAQQIKIIHTTLYIFLGYELLITFLYGFNFKSVVYILGPGILLVFCYSCYFFGYYVKVSVAKNRGFGKTFMITSLLFAYGCYGMVYCFYYLQQTKAVVDVYFIYYISSFLAAVLMSIGLIKYNKRYKELKDVQVVRKELQAFFGS